jgi:hypothetical protein
MKVKFPDTITILFAEHSKNKHQRRVDFLPLFKRVSAETGSKKLALKVLTCSSTHLVKAQGRIKLGSFQVNNIPHQAKYQEIIFETSFGSTLLLQKKKKKNGI